MKPVSDPRNDSIYEEYGRLSEQYNVNDETQNYQAENRDSVYEDYFTRYAHYFRNSNESREKVLMKMLKHKWWLFLSILILVIAGLALVLSLHFTATVVTVTEVIELSTTSSRMAQDWHRKGKAVLMLKHRRMGDPAQIVFGLDGGSFLAL